LPDDLPSLAYSRQELSVREQTVIQLSAEGRSTKEVASALHISAKIVETHREAIRYRASDARCHCERYCTSNLGTLVGRLIN